MLTGFLFSSPIDWSPAPTDLELHGEGGGRLECLSLRQLLTLRRQESMREEAFQEEKGRGGRRGGGMDGKKRKEGGGVRGNKRSALKSRMHYGLNMSLPVQALETGPLVPYCWET